MFYVTFKLNETANNFIEENKRSEESWLVAQSTKKTT